MGPPAFYAAPPIVDSVERPHRLWQAVGVKESNTMDALRVYSLLQESCRLLEANQDHAIAAMVGQAMAMVTESYGVGRDHLDDADH